MSNAAKHTPSLQEQFAQRRNRRKRKHVRSNNEEQDNHHHNSMHSEALFHEEDLEQRNGGEMQKDGEKDNGTKGNQLDPRKGTETNHETALESSHTGKHASLVDSSREPSYEALEKKQEQSQHALVATQRQYEVYREQSEQELETMREVCKRLLDQLKTREAELQTQTKKYSDLKEKYYKWYHCFLKVWAEKFHKNETEEPPPGIPNMSPRDSEQDRHPVVTPLPWPNRKESTSPSMGPKRLSASLRDSKETTGTSTERSDLLARVYKVDSSIEADESNDAGSVTQFGGSLLEMRSRSPVSALIEPKGLSASLCEVDNKKTISHGASNGRIGGGDKKASRFDSPLETEELHDAGSETQLNGPLPVKRSSSPPDEPIKSKRLSLSLRETDSKMKMPRGTLKEINEYWEKKTSRVTTSVQADTLNGAGSQTQLNDLSPGMRSTSPPNRTIAPDRLSDNEPMIRATSNGGVGASDKKRSRVASPIKADESDDVGSQMRLSGHSRERRSCSPANKSLELKRLSTSLCETDSKETMPCGRSKKTVDSEDRKTSQVDSPVQPDELNDALSEKQLTHPSPAKRSKSPARQTVEPKWLTASLRERSQKETVTRGIVKKTVDSSDKASPTAFDGPDDARRETQLSGHENPSNAPAKTSMAHKRLSASVLEADRKEAVTSESLKKRSESAEKETSRVDSAVQPDEMDDEMQLNGPSPEKRIRLEKMCAELSTAGKHQTSEKTGETGIDSSPVHRGSETQLGGDPRSYHEKKGIEGEELVFSKTLPSSPMEEISARKPGKLRPSGTKAVSPAKDISNNPAKLVADHEHEDPSQPLFSQLSEAPMLRQPVARAKPTPRTLKDRTNVKPVSARNAVPAWTSNRVARNFVQYVSSPSAGKKSPAKEERKPASVLPASTPCVRNNPPVKEERKPAFVPSAVPETRATNRNTGTMQPPRNPYAAQRPFVPKASVSSLSARRASSTLYEDSEDSYRYQEVVRCKHDRQNLPGHECPQCSNWVDSICHGEGGEIFNRKELMDCSRHRAAHSPENTPEGFWELSFADEIEARKRLNEDPAEDSESDESNEI
jgi:hypothetical protein